MNKNRETLMKFISEQNQKIQNDISKQGYKDNSPYRNNPFNIIQGTPQGTSITMKGVSTPLIGMDEYGNKQYMQPGQEYQFPGSQVTETPMYQRAGTVKDSGALLTKTIKCSNCGWEWKAADGGSDLYNCHKCKGGKGLIKAQRGKEIKRTDETSKVIKRIFEETEDASNWIEKTFNDALSIITPDYKLVEDKEKLFKTYRPVAYPGIGSAISNLIKGPQLPGKDAEGDLNIGEEAWKKALKLPVKEKYIIPSLYKPTTSKDSNSKYYTLNNVIDKEKIFDEAKKLGIKPGQKINLKSMAPYIRKEFMDVEEFSNIDPLQKFQINMDPDGKYISIYDKYDFDFAPADKVISPYEFYDRFYFDDKDIPKFKSLPKNRKQAGGEYFNQVKDWYNKYTNSPGYKENLIKSGYEDPQAIIDRRLSNISNTKFKHDENRLGSYYNNRANKIHYSPIKDQMSFPGDGPDDILAHEVGHSSIDIGDGFLQGFKPNYNEYDYEQLKKRNKNPKISRGPHENYADQKAIQYEAEKQGLYKAGYDEFTKEILDKLEYSDLKERALRNYSEDDLIWLLNNIAQNDDNKYELPIAQEGGAGMMYADRNYQVGGLTKYQIKGEVKNNSDVYDEYTSSFESKTSPLIGTTFVPNLTGTEAEGMEGLNCIGGSCNAVIKSGANIPLITGNDFWDQAERKKIPFIVYANPTNKRDYTEALSYAKPGDFIGYSSYNTNDKTDYLPSHTNIFINRFEQDGEEYIRTLDAFGGEGYHYNDYLVKDLIKGGPYNKLFLGRPTKINGQDLTIEDLGLTKYYKSFSYPPGLSPEEKQEYDDKLDFIKKESSSKKSYEWDISPTAKDYNPDTKRVMDKFIDFANDNDKINDLVKKTGSSRAEIQDTLLNVFGELGAENNWTTSKGKGLGSRLENITESMLTSLGGGKKLSVGPGQIKYSQLSKDLKQKYNITSPNDLYDLDKVLPLMVAMDLLDKKTLENWGEKNTLSKKLFGFTNPEGFTIEDLRSNSTAFDGVGRYSPYLRNQYSSIVNNEVTTGKNDWIPFNENTVKNFTGTEDGMNIQYKRDPGSYSYKVEQNWRNNLKRDIILNKYGALELSEVVIPNKQKVVIPNKQTGGLTKYQEKGEVKYGTPEYEQAYNRGEVVTEDGQYSPILLDEVVIPSRLTEFGKTRKEIAAKNTWEQFSQKFLGNFEKNMGQTLENLPEYRKQEYEEYINKLAFDEYVKIHPMQKGEKRGAYIDRMQTENANSSNFKRAYETNANYNDVTDINKWRKSLIGLGSIVLPKFAMDPLKQNSDYFSTKEKEDMRNNPISTRFDDVLGTIEPLTIPVEGIYGNKSFGQIASGENADIPMSARILADPMALVFEAAPLLRIGISTAGKALGPKEGLLAKLGALRETSAPVQNVVQEAAVVKPWQMEEMPGLHLKSTMDGQAISKIVEPKTGLVNVEQALGIIGKESSGAEKVEMVRKGLGDKIPLKMDFNKFRKVIQDQLIPLERQFSEQASNYGVGRLGYPFPKRSSYENAMKSSKEEITRLETALKYNGNIEPTSWETVDQIRARLKIQLDDSKLKLLQSEKELATLPLENQTLILGNKSKFGRGSGEHGNPEETLGHAHYLIDAETPDIINLTQLQSDPFQGTHRIMPKVFNKEVELRSLSHMEDIAKRSDEMVKTAKQLDNNTWQLADGSKVNKNVFDHMSKGQREINAMKKAEIENFTQKLLLDKDHQARFLQEFVNYAAQKGNINKVRVPTSETAAKVQDYSKFDPPSDANEIFNIKNKINILEHRIKREYDEDMIRNLKNSLKSLKEELVGGYKSEYQTILKKYSEQPKLIKKLFGQEPKIVTDSKGNTWYEFDIPETFKQGKGQIRAFKQGGNISIKQKKALSWLSS